MLVFVFIASENAVKYSTFPLSYKKNEILLHTIDCFVFFLSQDARAAVNPIGRWTVSYFVIKITDVDDLSASFTKEVYGPINIAENLPRVTRFTLSLKK